MFCFVVAFGVPVGCDSSGPRAPARQIKADLRVTLQGNKRESLGVRLTAEKMRTLAVVTDDEWNKE